ncbi:MAG: hypothetical protein QME51_08275, partial [Planctomycetota bacterium]|nr:hypothetical protein [Planctomycetota bacterium]
LSNANVFYSVTTSHFLSGYGDSYNLEIEVEGNVKQPVKVVLNSGPNITGPIDIAKRDWEGFNAWFWLNTIRPTVGDAYLLSITYSDSTSENVTATVTAVLDSFATNLTVITVTSTTVPTFTWTAPITPPAGTYTYNIRVQQDSAPYNTMWEYPDDGEMPSIQTSVIYNADERAYQPELTPEVTYRWSIRVEDENGNEATIETTYTPPQPPPFYSISGTVTYTGTKTGRVYIGVNWSGGGDTNWGTSISGTNNWTIRGVSPGQYVVYAWIDHIGMGSENASNPSGTSGTVYVTSGNVNGVGITLSDPTTVTPVTPAAIVVYPSDQSVFFALDTPEDAQEREIASAYKVYWSTAATVSKTSYLGSATFPAQDDASYFISGLTNGITYYFVATALVGAQESAETAPFGPVTVNATAGVYTVSGTITFTDVAPTGPLYVGAYSETEGPPVITYTRIANPSSPQNYSFSGVANGTYYLFAILDMNNNGVGDGGDIESAEEYTVTVNGANLPGQNITMPTTNALARVTTKHWQGGANENYDVEVEVYDGRKKAVAVAVSSGPGLSAVTDIRKDWVFRYLFNRGSTRPTIGDTYTFNVTFVDGTSENITASVTTVLDSFAQNLTVITITSTTVPTFTWSAPITPPAYYTYWLDVYRQSDNTQIWEYPSDEAGTMPSSQLSVLYNYDGQASQPTLTAGVTYRWKIRVNDDKGNEATIEVTYTPAAP